MKRFALLCVYLVVAACASSPQQHTETTTIRDVARAGDLTLATPGSRVDVRGAASVVLDDYVAASGRKCKSLLGDTDQQVRAACLGADGIWYVRDPLMHSGASVNRTVIAPAQSALSVPQHSGFVGTVGESLVQTPLPTIDDSTVQIPDASGLLSTATTSVPKPRVDPQRQIEVGDNENLWRFAKRVTGNATNWQTIARYNGVENAATLQAGTVLSIPPELTLLSDITPVEDSRK